MMLPDGLGPGTRGHGDEPSLVERYEALVRLSETLRSHHDRDALMQGLARELSLVVPFDILELALLDEDSRAGVVHGLDASGESDPSLLWASTAQLTHWVVAEQRPLVIDDTRQETRFTQGMAHLIGRGAMSACCLPLTTRHRRIGMLLAGARDSHRYARLDVDYLRLVATQVALAIDDAVRLDALQASLALERARRHELVALEERLRALPPSLDIREVFARVASIAQSVIPHDLAVLMLVPSDRAHIELHTISSGRLGPATTMAVTPSVAPWLTEPWDCALFEDVQVDARTSDSAAARGGCRGALRAAVRVGADLVGILELSARTAGAYHEDQTLFARRIAAHIALALSHQRLAEQSRLNGELRAREARLELVDALLETATDVGDLSEQFSRISEIARKVLPHDALTLPVVQPDGIHARNYAFSGLGERVATEIVEVPPSAFDATKDHYLVDDLQASDEVHNRVGASLGLKSALRIPIRLDGRLVASVNFLSRLPSAFTSADVVVAQRIAGRIGLALSKELRTAAAARADEAQQRASALEARVQALAAELNSVTGYRFVVGESPAWRRVLKQATQVAATDTTTLLLGESGTGKEVVARFVHRASSRSGGPFVALNCAALPEPLLESELFGFERGAFTGAMQSKPGQLEQAAGGVLFLDEVGEMSPSVQAKFLRVLQEREFQRLGGTRTLKANVRVVAATNRNLRAAVERGAFREDLYYRLNVFEITLPPLRDRVDDILPLSEAFLKEIARAFGRPPAGIAREARQALLGYRWPGNVRELRNVLERAAILCEGGLITSEHLTFAAPIESRPETPSSEASSAAPSPGTTDLRAIERTTIERALAEAKYNKSLAAKRLGLTRKQLYGRLRQHGLE